MRTVLGIDLASATWADNGSAELVCDAHAVRRVTPGAIAWPMGLLTPETIATAIDAHVRERGISAVALDGPQGWRDPATPDGTRGVGRRCELACQTQGKTGSYGVTYPRTQRPWIEFCIAVFDSLLERSGVVLANEAPIQLPADGYAILECFPTSAWRSSGLAPLPGKSRRPPLAPYVEALRSAYALPPFELTSHDDLQAVVAALCAAGVVGGPLTAQARGRGAFLAAHADGVRRRVEGIIWDVEPRGGPVHGTMLTAVPPERAAVPAAPVRKPPRSRGWASGRAAPAATVRVTQRVLDEVSRAASRHAMMIALRNVPGGTSAERRRVALAVGGEEYVLIVGDSHAIWRSHQSAATMQAFESLFALLADRPDQAFVIDAVRELSPDDSAGHVSVG